LGAQPRFEDLEPPPGFDLIAIGLHHIVLFQIQNCQ
jgi:hypothetical protein